MGTTPTHINTQLTCAHFHERGWQICRHWGAHLSTVALYRVALSIEDPQVVTLGRLLTTLGHTGSGEGCVGLTGCTGGEGGWRGITSADKYLSASKV